MKIAYLYYVNIADAYLLTSVNVLTYIGIFIEKNTVLRITIRHI